MEDFYCNKCDCGEFNVDVGEDIIFTCTECGEKYRVTNHIESWE